MSEELSSWIAIVGVALTAVVTRGSFVAFGTRMVLPKVVERSLRFAPAAVLGAIVAPALLMRQGHMDLGLGNARLIAAVATSLVIWRWRNMLAAIITGMAVLTLLRLVAAG
jgi:branched-subunit amino acid transport protein